MNRILLATAGVLSASSLLLVDSAVKGTALLALAAIVVLILRRDSAATRHLIWLLAIVAMLVVPVLSALLPQWRVLPQWAGMAPEPVIVEASLPTIAGPADRVAELPQPAEPVVVERPFAPAHQPAAAQPDIRPGSATPDAIPATAIWNWNWLDLLPLVWVVGFSALMLRLIAARWLLWNAERQGTVIWSSRQIAQATHDPIVTALEAVCSQLEIGGPLTLLIHPDKTIPVVWGVLRYRLLLPAAARQWSAEQLRSVLLHELAHVKRRDTIVQLLTQIACALHWFNPLVWFAAWRLGVERERACDDLVLAGGIRPSAYAGHLLDVVTSLAPARWTQSCGLAMARKSSLEGRLVAVLSDKLNRRSVSYALGAIALAIAVGVAVPIAMLRAADEKTVEKPKPATTDMKPKHEYAQALFRKWQAHARTDGKIPGALIGHVAREIDSFVKQYPQDEKTPKLMALRPRLDATHDWTQADVVALLDDITAISTAPVSWADIPLEFDEMRNLKSGRPLPVELKTIAWGAPAANGLRAAWLLEPRAEQYALGSVLKARVLFHNTGKEPVVFQTESWHQHDPHTARTAAGAALTVSGVDYSGITPMAKFRLAPDEYCEVIGHGIAIGAGKYEEEFSTGGVGAVIEAKEGDDVRLSHSVDATHGGWTKPSDPQDPAELWKKIIAERVDRDAPMPQALVDREQLIRRVTLDLFGVPPTAEEVAAFSADNAPDALAKLIARLQAKPRSEPWAGKLPTGETKFRVTAADPDAAKKPRTANSPGRYVLGDNIHLLVSQTTTGAHRTNKAVIAFLSPDPKVASPHQPYEIVLPDGIGTYGIVWERGAGVLWVMQKDLVRKYNFTDPSQVKETRVEPGSIADVPEQLRGALRKVFEAPGAAAPVKPGAAAAAVNVEPNDARSRPLFANWQTSARTDGKIPGGRIGEMAASLKTFMALNPGHEQSVKLEPVLKKCDSSRDWTPAEAAALLDEIAAITSCAEWTMLENTERKIRPGKPLPDELANAPWGKPAENGLRIAWLLEPRAETQALDSVMKSRVLFHNSGKATVCFATEDWIQTGGHKAKDANGKDIRVWALERMGMRLRMNFRLAPGEYAEVVGHGIGIGSHESSSEKSIYVVGCWIEAKNGDAVTFTPGIIPVSFQTWKNNEGRKDSVTVWREMIAARVMQEGPMPDAAADREQLLRRVMQDYPGTAPTAEEIAAFVADNDKDPLARLIKSLQGRCAAMHFAGELAGGETKFRVTAAAPKKAEPKPGAQLKPATEQKLKWGAPVNGLRMASAWPPSLGEPGMGDAAEFYLVVQNVSQAAVRLTASDTAPNPRRQTMWDNDRPLMATLDATPAPGDWLLQPREVAFLRLFQTGEKSNDGRTHSAAVEQAVRVYPQYSVTAEMSIEKAPAGAWTGKLATGHTRCSMDVIPPKNKYAQSLYKTWTTAARTDGKIPGGVIGQLADSVKTFTKSNPMWETTPQLVKMLPRFDASRDWNGQDAVALLDELAALQDTPIMMAVDEEGQRTIRTGTPLPKELANAPWGEALPNGLRLAWLLEPRAAEHRLNSALRSRILIHNSGKKDVVFRARTWHQGGHKATDANGAEIKVESTEWLTRGLLVPFRLAPGEFVELSATGIGVGANQNEEDWQNTRVGSWIEANAGDDVTITTNPVPLCDGNENPALNGEPRWWLDHITARLSRHLPFPADRDGRERLLERVAMELFGTSASDPAFVADNTPAALDSLAKRYFHRPGLHAWAGPLTSGPTKFRVLPADPDAAKKPRVANNPGRYTLGENIRLIVSRRPADDRIVNEARIQFFSVDPAKPAPGEPHEIKLPDGYDTWAAAWVRGTTVLWVLQKGSVRSYDFTNSAQVKETTLEEPANLDKVPKPILDALRAALDVPKPAPVAPKQPPGASK
jgi:beta-lactamase regulating signal transducer with metallopeptidase domain